MSQVRGAVAFAVAYGMHLTPALLHALKQGTLPEAERAIARAHLESCEECQARGDDSAAPTGRIDPAAPLTGEVTEAVPHPGSLGDRLARGATVGRYVIDGVLGEGGMGVVYAARDPELDRPVAIKLLQGRGDGSSGLSGGQAWLVREAQALARLSHPNVIAVHDVGTLPGERVFVAMELVKGRTLRAVLKERPKAAEFVRLLVAAGEGLAAAHRAGLVHRDFKPDNVLVGDDGQVKVLDFGLARIAPRDGAPSAASTSTANSTPTAAQDDAGASSLLSALGDASSTSRSGALSASLTQVGQLIGTPAYMAPELYEGAAADAKSDQFAFGVTLYLALAGALPWPARAEQRAPGARFVPPPFTADVDPRLARVALRCLSVAPADRYPSLDDALAELRVDPSAARQRRAIAAAVVVAVAAVVTVVGVAQANARRCSGFESRLAGVWDAEVRARAEAAFTKSERSFSTASFAGAARLLDAWSVAWVAAASESCTATQIDRRQSEEVGLLRQQCLDQRLDELRALTGVLATADAAVVERADKAVFALAPLSSCADAAALAATPRVPSDPAKSGDVSAARTHLAAAKAKLAAGLVEPAVVDANAARDAARALAYAPWEAEAELVLGNAHKAAGKSDDAVKALQQATRLALAAKHDAVATAAVLDAAEAASALGGDKDAVFLDVGAALVARQKSRPLEVRRLEVAGVIAAAHGQFADAARSHEMALTAARGVFGENDPALWRNEQLLGSSLAKAGAWAAAIPHYERALALKRAVSGDEHPDIATIFASLGGCYTNVGALDKAADALTRALDVREAVFGRESPKLVAPLNNLADLLRQKGELDAALAHVERGVAIAATKPGPTHPLTHTIQTTHGEILLARGDTAGAKERLDETLALERAAKSPILPTTLTARAAVALAVDDVAGAVDATTAAIAALEGSGGAETADLWRPLFLLAQAKQRRSQDAKAELTRSLALAEKNGVATKDVDAIKAALAP